MFFYESYFLDIYNRQMKEYLPNFDAYKISRRITKFYRSINLIAIILWVVFIKDILLVWIPMIATWSIAVLMELIFLKAIPSISYKIAESKYIKKLEVEESQKRQEKLLEEIAQTKKTMEENIFGIPMCKNIINNLSTKDVNMCNEEFQNVLNKLSVLIDEAEKAGTDIDKYQMLFGKTLSDVYRIVTHAESESQEKVLEMLKAMLQYIDSEIESIRLYPNMEIKSTIDAYTQLFKSKTGKEFFND